MGATASQPDLSTLLPAGMAGLLEQAKAALATAEQPNADVLEVAARLGLVLERLDIVTTNLEMALDMFARLGAGWNALATNVDALTAIAGKPLNRAGLMLLEIPRV